MALCDKKNKNMNFEHLINLIYKTHNVLQINAIKAVNRNLTIRNWLIGFYIKEFEQNGEDRAKYGEKLLQKIAERLNQNSFSYRNLKLYRQFYQIYQRFFVLILDIIQNFDLNRHLSSADFQISQLSTDQLQIADNKQNEIGQLPIAQLENEQIHLPPSKIIENLSFTHLVQLLPIENPLKRTFYELECIKGTWSVEELKRQINSLYFERSGMSQNPEKLSQYVQNISTKENTT